MCDIHVATPRTRNSTHRQNRCNLKEDLHVASYYFSCTSQITDDASGTVITCGQANTRARDRTALVAAILDPVTDDALISAAPHSATGTAPDGTRLISVTALISGTPDSVEAPTHRISGVCTGRHRINIRDHTDIRDSRQRRGHNPQ